MPASQALLSLDPPAGDSSSPSRDSPSPSQVECEMRSGEESRADDLSALRLVKVPDWGQPFDGDPATGDGSAAATGEVAAEAGDSAAWAAGRFGYSWASLDRDTGADPRNREAMRHPTAREAGIQVPETADAGRGPRAAGTQRPETPGEWPGQFARLLAEALAGARPVRQILPWTSERARAHLHRLMPLFGGGQRPRVLRVIATRPTRDVIEMTVIVGIGARTRALAVRLEQASFYQLARPAEYVARGVTSAAGAPRWVCTDIEAA